MSNNEEITLPEVTAQELSGWLETRPEVILLDVREPYEFPRAVIPDPRVLHAPLSDLARKGDPALPSKLKENQNAPVVVFCHHGFRSAQVTAWLLELGWTDVYNLTGGIDAYSRTIDPSIGLY